MNIFIIWKLIIYNFFYKTGQPQMIKLVQQPGKTMSGVMSSTITGQSVKVFKSIPTSAESSQVIFFYKQKLFIIL